MLESKAKKLVQAVQDGKIVDDKSLALYQILEDATEQVDKMDGIKTDVENIAKEAIAAGIAAAVAPIQSQLDDANETIATLSQAAVRANQANVTP